MHRLHTTPSVGRAGQGHAVRTRAPSAIETAEDGRQEGHRETKTDGSPKVGEDRFLYATAPFRIRRSAFAVPRSPFRVHERTGCPARSTPR